MRQIELLVEAYLMAERDLVAVVDAAGGTVPLPDGEPSGWSGAVQRMAIDSAAYHLSNLRIRQEQIVVDDAPALLRCIDHV
jgi:hypothetical protein